MSYSFEVLQVERDRKDAKAVNGPSEARTPGRHHKAVEGAGGRLRSEEHDPATLHRPPISWWVEYV